MTRFAHALTHPQIYLPGIAVAVIVAGVAALLMMPAPEAVAATIAPAGPLPVAAIASGRDRSCDSCGFVETIRRTDPATGSTTYEFSVRMRDGSTRASTATKRGRWLEGERVILIGGAAARALEEEKNTAL